MAAFSFQHHHPFLLDSVFFQTPTIKASVFPHEGENNSSPISFYERQSLSQTKTHEREVFAVGNSANSSQEASFTEKPADSSSVATDLLDEDKAPEKQAQTHNSRKKRERPSLNSAQSKRKCSGNPKENEEKKAKGAKKNEKKGTEEEPKGVIHVRARRGQATDSHSLAERVRREKISERMKMLQALVPGCDKVTGKALQLDEIINYVQSLQNQVEFLSMKLASVNPVFYDFSVDLDNYTSKPEKIRTIPSPLPFIQQSSYGQDPDFSADTAPVTTAAPLTTTITTFPIANSYSLMDSSVAALPHWQRPDAFSQDNVNLAWNLDSYNNMCSFP